MAFDTREKRSASMTGSISRRMSGPLRGTWILRPRPNTAAGDWLTLAAGFGPGRLRSIGVDGTPR